MKFLFNKEQAKPFSYITLSRALILIIFVLAILTGYYKAVIVSERKKYMRLEDRYVRVRSELGIDETQRLIDQSHLD